VALKALAKGGFSCAVRFRGEVERIPENVDDAATDQQSGSKSKTSKSGGKRAGRRRSSQGPKQHESEADEKTDESEASSADAKLKYPGTVITDLAKGELTLLWASVVSEKEKADKGRDTTGTAWSGFDFSALGFSLFGSGGDDKAKRVRKNAKADKKKGATKKGKKAADEPPAAEGEQGKEVISHRVYAVNLFRFRPAKDSRRLYITLDDPLIKETYDVRVEIDPAVGRDIALYVLMAFRSAHVKGLKAAHWQQHFKEGQLEAVTDLMLPEEEDSYA